MKRRSAPGSIGDVVQVIKERRRAEAIVGQDECCSREERHAAVLIVPAPSSLGQLMAERVNVPEHGLGHLLTCPRTDIHEAGDHIRAAVDRDIGSAIRRERAYGPAEPRDPVCSARAGALKPFEHEGIRRELFEEVFDLAKARRVLVAATY